VEIRNYYFDTKSGKALLTNVNSNKVFGFLCETGFIKSFEAKLTDFWESIPYKGYTLNCKSVGWDVKQSIFKK
jgi:hypothetical protein